MTEKLLLYIVLGQIHGGGGGGGDEERKTTVFVYRQKLIPDILFNNCHEIDQMRTNEHIQIIIIIMIVRPFIITAFC